MEINPEFIVDFETNLQATIVDEWKRVTKAGLCWDQFMVQRKSSSKKDIIRWLLTTAQIHSEDNGGQTRFDDIVATSLEIENENHGAGLILRRNSIEDNELDDAGQWAAHMGSASAYWPEEKLFELILAGESELAYDGVAYFATTHKINPYKASLGNYANLIGARPIDSSVTLDVATTNLTAVVSAIKTIKMPNGKFRKLRPTKLMGPPQLEARLKLLTGAQFFGLGSTNTTASADNVLRSYGFAPPTIAEELSADATSWYIGCEDITASEVGAFIFQERKPWRLDTYQGETEAALNRRDEFEWHFKGRNVAAYGHPYLFFKVKAAAL